MFWPFEFPLSHSENQHDDQPHQTAHPIVGYGSQGRAHALNLRDSGFDVTVGLRPGGRPNSRRRPTASAVKGAGRRGEGHRNLIAVLTPDMVQPQLYNEVLAPSIKQRRLPAVRARLNVHSA